MKHQSTASKFLVHIKKNQTILLPRSPNKMVPHILKFMYQVQIKWGILIQIANIIALSLWKMAVSQKIIIQPASRLIWLYMCVSHLDQRILLVCLNQGFWIKLCTQSMSLLCHYSVYCCSTKWLVTVMLLMITRSLRTLRQPLLSRPERLCRPPQLLPQLLMYR